MADPTALLQALHDSEISGSIAWYYDGVFTWTLGSEADGVKASGHASSLTEAVDHLVRASLEHYPNSEFARRSAAAG